MGEARSAWAVVCPLLPSMWAAALCGGTDPAVILLHAAQGSGGDLLSPGSEPKTRRVGRVPAMVHVARATTMTLT